MKYYWFIFCKSDLLLEKTDNEYLIPLSEESPVALRSWTQVMKVSPTINRYEVRALNIDTPSRTIFLLKCVTWGRAITSYKVTSIWQQESVMSCSIGIKTHNFVENVALNETSYRDFQTMHELRKRNMAASCYCCNCTHSRGMKFYLYMQRTSNLISTD